MCIENEKWKKERSAYMESIRKIVKRDGRTVDFDVSKIADAIFRAAQVLGGRDSTKIFA